MKKPVFFFLVVLLSGITDRSYAQKFGDGTGMFEIPVSLSGNKEFIPMEWSVDIGCYMTDWLAVVAKGDTFVGLFNENNVRSYSLSSALGGGLNFDVLKRGRNTLSVRAFCGATLGRADWKYTYYSGGVYFSRGNGDIKPTIGLGVKYYDTNKGYDFDDYLRVYLSLGFRFN